MEKRDPYKNKNTLQKIWYFLWKDESLISWIVLLLLGFCTILFVFFPVSSLIFSSKLPFVVIESGSMIHEGDFDKWWENFGVWYENRSITKEQFEAFSYKNGMNIGDIIVVMSSDDYKVGDVIVFSVPDEKPIIHRIAVRKTKCNITERVRDNIYRTEEEECNFTSTKGDNNQGQLNLELNITQDKIIGKAIFLIPKAGYAKLIPCMIIPDFCEFIDMIRR